MNLKNIVGLTFLYFLNTSCMELTLPEDANTLPTIIENNHFKWLPHEILSLIAHNCDIETTRNIKYTCKEFDKYIHYHQISTANIQSENYDQWAAGICRFIITEQERNLEKLFENNTIVNIKDLRILDATLKDNTIFTYNVIKQLYDKSRETITNFNWVDILSNNIILSMTLCNSASLNELDASGETSIMQAIRFDNQKILLLLKNGANPNLQNKYGFMPLEEAIVNNKLDVATLLLNNGANPNLQNKHGLTPLKLAINNNNLEMTKLLLTNYTDQNVGIFTQLARPIIKGNLTIAPFLLNNNAQILVTFKRSAIFALSLYLIYTLYHC